MVTWIAFFFVGFAWMVLVADAVAITRAPRAHKWEPEFPPLSEDDENELLFGDWPRGGP